MDISVIKALCRELSAALQGSRISGLKEGDTGEIYLVFRGNGGIRTLLVNPRPAMPRFHLITKKPASYRDLTPFGQGLMHLLAGSSLVSVSQEGLERAVQFHFTRKRRGEHEETTLVLELAGKKPNLIALDGHGKILIAQSCVPLSDEVLRPLLPGLAYQPPPRPDKLDPSSITSADIDNILSRRAELPTEKALFMDIGGLSPMLAGEVIALSANPRDPRSIFTSLKTLLMKMDSGDSSPCIYETPAGPVLSAFHLAHYKESARTDFDTMNEAAEVFYGSLLERRDFIAAQTSLLREKRAKLAAARKKLLAIESDIARADKADSYQLYGNMLMASLKDVPEGAASVSLTDYTTGGHIDVPLDPKLGAVKNAEAYYRKARKARAGLEVLGGRLKAAREEIKDLEALLEKTAETNTMDELSLLVSGPPLKSKQLKVSRKLKDELPEFSGFVSSDGYEILYAKNAKGNDVLTFKLAQPMDMWLHAQGYHGAHVIVRNPERRPDIPLQTILEAAEAAAYHSGAKKDSDVAVDYTFRKYVRKPKDPAPGQAIFTGNKTVFVEPKKR
jgi:predicted ribosome quality control (RQC) complex YloA/Tae2 family protein